MLPRICLLTTLLFACQVAGATSEVNRFVPGEPMSFPVRSDGVSDDLVSRLGVNCQTEDSARTETCTAMLQARAEGCTPKPPEVFGTETIYRRWAKAFAQCVFPKPICNGVEVDAQEQCAHREIDL